MSITGADSGRASATELEESAVATVQLREPTTPPPPISGEDVFPSRVSHTTWYLPVEDSSSPPASGTNEARGASPDAEPREGDAAGDSSMSTSDE
ncbi:GD11010 [Drosophila simulans]|nr:GD11010 [Drosophila simulans]